VIAEDKLAEKLAEKRDGGVPAHVKVVVASFMQPMAVCRGSPNAS
jgi:hypothetical protein